MELTVTADPVEAVRDAAVVYTDVGRAWARRRAGSPAAQFAGYQVNAALMRRPAQAVFMHCLPAHRGDEVTDEVIDGPQSVVFQQAANRMHARKGCWLGCWGSRNRVLLQPAEDFRQPQR